MVLRKYLFHTFLLSNSNSSFVDFVRQLLKTPMACLFTVHLNTRKKLRPEISKMIPLVPLPFSLPLYIVRLESLLLIRPASKQIYVTMQNKLR